MQKINAVYVYVLASPLLHNTVKVGVSYNPYSRCEDVSYKEYGNRHTLFVAKVIGPFHRKKALAIEYDIHGMLHSYKIKREWFNVSLSYALDKVEQLNAEH